MGKSNLPLIGRPGVIITTVLAVLVLSTCATSGPGTKSAQSLPAPVGEWLMNGSLSDSSGNGNNGTSLGGTRFAPDRHGVPNAALSVSAITGPDNNANVSFGTGLLLPASSSFTLSLWFLTPTYVGSYADVFSAMANENQFSYGINLDGDRGKIQTQVGPNDVMAFGPAAPYTLNMWHNIVEVYDGRAQTVTGYLDGDQFGVSSAKYTYDSPLPAGPLIIGGSTPQFAGLVDDIRIFAAALTPSQVQELFRQ
jgi:hypothetical protein